ncbi:accessory Sec system S-layer assembly protein [Cytobacillus oceanisediminis]|uniref:accessory Sec system S-layer assembly protein n=1 Tax=Cytobacillus oceanisediminis TaxID=665099 RepID=UPI003734D629
MLSFFKRKDKNIEKTGSDSVVDSRELLGNGEGEAGSEKLVETELSFHPKVHVGTEERYYFQFLQNELPPLKENQISLSGIELKKDEDIWQIVAFVRNSLAKSVKFKETPLLLIGPDGEKLGRKVFNLADIGELPAASSRPWVFEFHQSDLEKEELPATGWKLAFEIKAQQPEQHRLDLHESWEKSLAENDKEKLEKLVSSVEPPKKGEVNFMGIQAAKAEDGSLHVTLLVRNGSMKNLKLEKLPLIVEDASDEVIVKGGFNLDNFEVKANTSKPWTFIFPKEMLLKEEIDLSKWKAYPPQKG